MSLHAAIESRGRSHADELAIIDGDVELTWSGLHTATCALAHHWREAGLERGSRIATALSPDIDFAVCLAAASRIGACVVPMDLRFRSADLESALGKVDINALVAVEEFEGFALRSAMTAITKVPRHRSYGVTHARAQDTRWALEYPHASNASATGSADDSLLIIFTGGSTGRPKGAVLRQRHVAEACRIEYAAIGRHFDRHADGPTFVLSALPTSHVGGAAEIVAGALLDGLSLVCLPEWHPVAAMEAQQRYAMPVIAGVPAMYSILLDMGVAGFDTSALQVAVCSGDRFPGHLAERVRRELTPNILVSYGMTEANVLTLTEPDISAEALNDGYVGRCLSGVELRVDEQGELQARGPQVIDGYLEPAETEVAFADGWFRTGDLGRVVDGDVWITGRLKQIIRVGSYTVLPHEVEAVALAYPSVATCAVVGRADERVGETVALFVTAADGTSIDPDALAAHLAEHLAEFKRPRTLRIETELPRTRADKIDREALKRRLEEET